MTDKIPLVAVIGHPIKHSKSPRLHGHWLSKYGIAGHYIPVDLSPENFETGLNALKDLGFVGANVTVPHKEAALAAATTITDRARRIGAANTLILQADGTWLADNTDGYGFMANLSQNAPDWSATNGPALVLGAGGACRAVIDGLLGANCPQIILTNRSAARAEALASEFGMGVETLPWEDRSNPVSDMRLVVNTTSLGMVGQPELEIDLNGLNSTCLVTDLVYTPLETKLLQNAKARGAKTVDGLGMLLHQAVPGFEAWFGRRPEVDDDLREVVQG